MEYTEALCKLHLCISHEMYGNYTKMNDIMKRSGILKFSSNKYFQYNLFYALFMEGIIDLVWKESGLIWCINKDLLDNNKKDEYLFAENLFKEGPLSVKVSNRNKPLTYSRNQSNGVTKISFDNVCSIGEVVDASVIEESISTISGNDLEVYSYSDNKWDQKEFFYDESCLLRMKGMFYGYKYYIYIIGINKVFRIIEPEWLFIIGAYMLNHDFREIFKLDGQLLKINSSIRMPTIIARYLFDSSENVELDYIHLYRGISADVVEELLAYLVPWSAS